MLGLGALQVAVVAARAGSAARVAASGLAAGVLEEVLAEARAAYLARQAEPALLGTVKYTDAETSRWVERCDPPGNGLPGFTVTVTRSDPPGAPSVAPGVELPGRIRARTFQAAVTWREGAAGAPRSLALARIVSY
jgi:hypothetical protein